MKDVSEYSMFTPSTSRRLTIDYPELREYTVLKELSEKELVFCWYMGCESSPYFDALSKRSRKNTIEKIIKHVYKSNISGTQKEKLLGNLNAKLTEAIKIFESMRIGPRIRSKMINEKIFANLETIVNVDISDGEFKETDEEGNDKIDWAKRRLYTQTVLDISKNLPLLVKQSEYGFALTEKEEAVQKKEEGGSLLDNILEGN